MRWVVDASAAVEILLKTAAGASAWKMIESDDCWAPDLLDAEVLAVLRREVLRGRLEAPRAEQALDDLAAWDIERVASRTLLFDAWQLRHNVSGYDALYVAAAIRHEAALVTIDGPLARAPSLGIAVHDVRA